MTTPLLWAALSAWVALMGIVWALFVPKGLSVGAFTLLSLSGPLFLATASKSWSAHRPSRSARADPSRGGRELTTARVQRRGTRV